jgi:hypothetical protein
VHEPLRRALRRRAPGVRARLTASCAKRIAPRRLRQQPAGMPRGSRTRRVDTRGEEANLRKRVFDAERSEADAIRRKQEQAQRRTERREAAERRAWDRRLMATEAAMREVVTNLRAPTSERLRVLLLGSSSMGDLRVGREQKRIRAAGESARVCGERASGDHTRDLLADLLVDRKGAAAVDGQDHVVSGSCRAMSTPSPRLVHQR